MNYFVSYVDSEWKIRNTIVPLNGKIHDLNTIRDIEAFIEKSEKRLCVNLICYREVENKEEPKQEPAA